MLSGTDSLTLILVCVCLLGMQFDLTVTNSMLFVVRVNVTLTQVSKPPLFFLSLSPSSFPPIYLILHSSPKLSPSSVCPRLTHCIRLTTSVHFSIPPLLFLPRTIASCSVSLFPPTVLSALSVSPSVSAVHSVIPITPSLTRSLFQSHFSLLPLIHLIFVVLSSHSFILSSPLSPLLDICPFIHLSFSLSLSFTSPLPYPLCLPLHLFFVPSWSCPCPSSLPPFVLSYAALLLSSMNLCRLKDLEKIPLFVCEE